MRHDRSRVGAVLLLSGSLVVSAGAAFADENDWWRGWWDTPRQRELRSDRREIQNDKEELRENRQDYRDAKRELRVWRDVQSRADRSFRWPIGVDQRRAAAGKLLPATPRFV